MNDSELERLYQLLKLDPGASADEVQQAYIKELARLRREGSKSEKAQLTVVYNELLAYTQNQAYAEAQAAPQQTITKLINQHLQPYQLQAEVKIQEEQLRIIFDANTVAKNQVPLTIIKKIIADLELVNINLVKVYGMRKNRTIIWKQEIPLITINPVEKETQHLLKEAERKTNLLAFPLAVVIALALNFTGLSWLWIVWVHEFGHATLAWFAGYRALPTLALTVMTTKRSLFVYFGILFLIGLLFWSARKEKKPWTMGLAVFLAILQFYLTWILSGDTYEMLQAFAGVGGEFYLSTFLIVCFYLRLPERLCWEFWRYIALLVASSTLLDNLWKWHRISQGKGSIPWGSFWGGSDAAGDMDILQIFGWTDQQIINTYNTLGSLCLWLVLGVYIFIVLQQNRQFWLYIQRLIHKNPRRR
jgi:hypothetical protein